MRNKKPKISWFLLLLLRAPYFLYLRHHNSYRTRTFCWFLVFIQSTQLKSWWNFLFGPFLGENRKLFGKAKAKGADELTLTDLDATTGFLEGKIGKANFVDLMLLINHFLILFDILRFYFDEFFICFPFSALILFKQAMALPNSIRLSCS